MHEPVRLAGGTLAEHRHVCAFFNGADEHYRVLLPFIKDGLEHGDLAFHVVNPRHRVEHRRRLKSAGIELARIEETGQFELGDWEQVYFPGGGFDQDKMLSLLEERLERGKSAGRTSRMVCEMEWALEDTRADDLLEYEARFNHVSSRYPDPVVCCYDLARFPASTVLDALRTHPMVILGGLLQTNPFYTPPDQFLLELRERKERSPAR